MPDEDFFADIPAEPESLTIISLEASNIKRLKAVKIVPKGSTVVISGKNDQGKTSTMDCIEYALAGNAAICDVPVRLGQDKAKIVCVLGEAGVPKLIVKKRFTANGGVSGFEVIDANDAEGVPQKSPQSILDALCNLIAWDPLSFVRMKPVPQLELLRKLVGIDLTELNQTRERVFKERTVVGNNRDNATGRLTAYPLDPNAPKEEVSITALTQKLAEVKGKNLELKRADERIEEREQALRRATAARERISADIVELERQISQKRNDSTVALTTVRDAEAAVKSAKEAAAALTKLDETVVQSEIDSIQETNAKVRRNASHYQVQAEITKHEGEYKHLTSEIEGLDFRKQTIISQAKFPLPGLSLNEDGVLLNGVPFSQGSQARQLQAAVAIGLALNPKLRVILIRDGSLLDEDSMKLVAEMAEKHKAQVWIEVVNSKDPAAVIIEDGEVVK